MPVTVGRRGRREGVVFPRITRLTASGVDTPVGPVVLDSEVSFDGRGSSVVVGRRDDS